LSCVLTPDDRVISRLSTGRRTFVNGHRLVISRSVFEEGHEKGSPNAPSCRVEAATRAYDIGCVMP